MKDDPYRIKFENGKITIALFQKGNPIPYTYFKGEIDKLRTQKFLKDIENKIADRKARDFVKSFILVGENYGKRVNKDFENYGKGTKQ